MIRFSRFLLLSATLGLFGTVSAVQAQDAVGSSTPVVMELFTSQSCSFCPPADALIGDMAKQDGVIALACHVDYFGVREHSLGRSFCTQRQNAYNRLIGNGPRYTPELVINGHMDMIGYEKQKVSIGVLKARAEKLAQIDVVRAQDGSVSYTLPALKGSSTDIKLWAAVYDMPKTLSLMEGSNFGKKLTYYNVVSDLQDLGGWDGAAGSHALGLKALGPENAGVAVIAQNIKTGRIVAAGNLKRSDVLGTAP